MGICLWILFSTIVAVSLLLLSVFDGKKDELRDNVVFPDGSLTAVVSESIAEPKERLKNLDRKLSSKSNKLEISQEKLDETKKTISELEVTSGEVHKKYRELLGQLKLELTKTETECLNLHKQIEQITTKRDKLKQELDEQQLQFSSEIGIFCSEASLSVGGKDSEEKCIIARIPRAGEQCRAPVRRNVGLPKCLTPMTYEMHETSSYNRSTALPCFKRLIRKHGTNSDK